MQHVSLMSFCERTGLTSEQVTDYEARGLIRSTTKGKSRFYSMSDVYRTKGLIYFMRTGLSPEDAAARIDQDTIAANRRSQ